MKIAILDIHYTADTTTLTAIPFASLSNKDARCVGTETYVFYSQADVGLKPDDLDAGEKGRWRKVSRFNSKYFAVDDSYDFATNNATDKSSIDLWHSGVVTGIDYTACTSEMSKLFDGKTGDTEADKLANCTATEKTCLAMRHIIVSKTERLNIVSADEDKANFFHHAKYSILCRNTRIETAILAIGYEIEAVIDRQDLVTDTLDKVGRFVKSNDPDIKDWMKSIGAYIGGGFKAKSYWKQEIEDIYIAIVENGIY